MLIKKHFQQGVTLVESMIALLVISIGLLGIASLQITAMSQNASSLNHSQAVWYAYNMSDRIRANISEFANYDGIDTSNSYSQDCLSSACTNAQMLTADAADWAAMTGNLPGGRGIIAATADGLLVSVMWDDEGTGATGTNCGTSLVEILVALVISLFLLGGIVQVYLGNKTTFKFTNALAEIQENGRFALDWMSQDLRMSNEWGCVRFNPADTDNINNTINTATFTGYNSNFHDFVGEEAVEGTNNAGLNGSDTVTIRGGKPGQANVKSPFFPTGTASLNVTTGSRIGQGDFVLVTRCGANDLLIEAEADILRVTNSTTVAATTLLTFAGTKSQQFENDASVIELQTVTYSIANGASGEPSLFRTEFGTALELVEGIEEMQILYGVDNNSDQSANQYVSSNNVADFEDVVSIRVMLLVRSIDDFVAEAPQTYSFNGAQTTPADRRLRQVFTATVALRNRIGS